MLTYVDFRQLKQDVGIDQVVGMLGIELKTHGKQLRGRCPIHRGTNDREFVVTPSKGLFYCFAGCGGGDLITLVAKVKGVGNKDAANLIAERFGLGTGTVPGTGSVPGTGTVRHANSRNSSPQPAGQTRPDPHSRILQPLSYLEADHELIQALGLSAETAMAFGAGYAPKGIMRGRMAIPLHDRDGTLLAYCGRAVRGESPALIFPNGFDPARVIFNAHRVSAGELHLVRDPLQVLVAFDGGIENVAAFLTESVTAQQLEMLAALMDEKQCETVELF